MADMKRADVVVTRLLDALDMIVRAANQPNNQPYIQGVAEQAIRMAHHDMMRNSDGYHVVKP